MSDISVYISMLFVVIFIVIILYPIGCMISDYLDSFTRPRL